MQRISAVLVLSAAFACGPAWAGEVRNITNTAIAVSDFVESNIPVVRKLISPAGLEFRSTNAAPPGSECYFVCYRFTVAAKGLYRVRVKTARGQRSRSDFSYAIDGGARKALVHQRLVGEPQAWRVGCEAAELDAGEHALELRFFPDQRARVMNRVTEDYEGHSVLIAAIEVGPAAEPKVPAPEPLPGHGVLLRKGDRVVFLGDSITDEELYPGHVARIVRNAWPDSNMTFYNSGIALNRAVDVLARLERDVLPLHPQWVILCVGVNDAMQFAPDEFERYYDQILARLVKEGIRVVCVTPTGFLAERFPESGQYVHTRDRARALDRTAAYEAEVVHRQARQRGLFVDALGALTRADLPRDRLMANQWHPSSEGGRLMALAVVRALGLSNDDAARTKEPLDAEYCHILDHVESADHPRYRAEEKHTGETRGPMVAVSSFTLNAVSLLNRATGKLVAQIPVRHHPGGLAFSARRRELYVACEGTGAIDVIDVAACKKVASVPLDDDDYPNSIVLTPDGATAWVANYYSSSVAEIDVQGRKVRRRIPVGGLAQSVALIADPRRVLAGTTSGIAVVDPAAGRVVSRLPVDFAGAFLPLPGDRVGAIETVYWRMHVFHARTLDEGTEARSPFAGRGIARDPSSGALWAGDWQNHRLVTIPAEGSNVRPVADIEFPFGVALVE